MKSTVRRLREGLRIAPHPHRSASEYGLQPATNTWEQSPSLIDDKTTTFDQSYQHAAATGSDGRIYVLGGVGIGQDGTQNHLKSVQAFRAGKR